MFNDLASLLVNKPTWLAWTAECEQMERASRRSRKVDLVACLQKPPQDISVPKPILVCLFFFMS